MGRLASVEWTRIKVVVSPNRDVECLFKIAVEIAERQREGSVRVRIPALERRTHALPGPVRYRRVAGLGGGWQRYPHCGNYKSDRNGAKILHFIELYRQRQFLTPVHPGSDNAEVGNKSMLVSHYLAVSRS